MTRCFLLILLSCLMTNGLFAQKKNIKTPQSLLTLEIGLPIKTRQGQHFPIPINIEWQYVKNKWGLGAALGVEYNNDASGDCSKRLEIGSVVKFDPGNGAPIKYAPYCNRLQELFFKPSLFASYYFLKKKKWQLFAQLGLKCSIWSWYRDSGDYYEFETTTSSTNVVTHKVINPNPIYFARTRRSWNIGNIDLLSRIGMNYALNKRMSVRFTLQSETNIPFLNKYDEKGVFLSGLCGLTYKL